MAENPSGKGPGDTGRHEPAREVSRPPAARRDPRADPDDDEPISARIDVISVERSAQSERGVGGGGSSGIDSLTNAALTLRRELAKLHQQAAAVERTIEDQRRERSDALERVEYATTKVSDLEQKLEQSEAEVASVRRLHDQALSDLQRMRSERDDLLRAIEAAKIAADDLGKARAEAETLREAHDEALRAASTYEAELAEIRKREQAGSQKVSDTQAELSSLRERAEHTAAELTQSREEATSLKGEVARFRQEASAAGETIAKLREDADRERAITKEAIERLERINTEARAESRGFEEKLGAAEGDLGALRVEVTQSRTEITRLERELEAARHSRDVSLERATMAEKETEGVRKDAERLQRELEAAVIAGAHAQTRAATAERAKSFVEDSVRQLRDEVTTAFARWRSISPSVAPPGMGSVAPPTRAMPPSLQEQTLASANANVSAAPGPGPSPSPPPAQESGPPPMTKRGEETSEPNANANANASANANAHAHQKTTSFPPISAEARPLSSPSLPQNSPPPAIDLNLTDDDWPSKPPPPPTASSKDKESDPDKEPISTSSPSSRSVPPPLPPRSRPPPLPPPRRTPSSAAVIAAAASIPPVVYPSITPVGSGSAPTSPPPADTTPDPKKEEGSGVKVLSQERDDLLSRLGDPDTGRAAAMALRNHTDWLKGRPPVELLEALTHLDYDIEHPLFELARSWDRESLCRSLIHSLKDEPDVKLREHGAWLLKHLGSPTIWPMMSDLVRNEDESLIVRRWILEAIERLVASRGIGWREVGDLVNRLVRHPDPSLRDGVIGVVAALERSDEKRRLLLELLRTDDDEIVLASAVHALASALPIELDPAVAERLLGHPSARVQRSVVDFIERSKRAARNA